MACSAVTHRAAHDPFDQRDRERVRELTAERIADGEIFYDQLNAADRARPGGGAGHGLVSFGSSSSSPTGSAAWDR
jgi:hypothetical protein